MLSLAMGVVYDRGNQALPGKSSYERNQRRPGAFFGSAPECGRAAKAVGASVVLSLVFGAMPTGLPVFDAFRL
jgi:hypothetical protein